MIIIDRSDVTTGDFDIEFNYDQILWEAGRDSQGDASCLGGNPARAGFSDGTAANSFEIEGSGVVGAFLDSNQATGLINTSTDSGGQLGRHVFPVRGGAPAALNQAPVIANQAFSVDENSANGTAVGTVAASDPDTGDTISFSITAGNTGDAFAIGASSGDLTVNNTTQLDFETTPSFSLTVQVQDSGGLTATATVTVNLNDLNEAPTIANQAFGVDENSGNGTVLGTVAASDVDTGDTLTFSITAGNTGSAFAIGSTTGDLTVNDTTQLDFETTPSFSLTVQVADSGALTADATVTVNLTDVNETPSIDDQAFGVDENSADGTVVGTVAATDVDTGDTLTFSITAGNTGSAFAIGSTTGDLTVNDTTQLDFETTPSFSLTVQVADSGALTADATVTVNLTDVNETPSIDNQAFGVDENSANGTVVGTVAATDVDTGDTLTFSITGGNTGSAFAIDPSTGQLTVSNSGQLDFEAIRSFSLTVQVQDSGGLTATATVTVTVNDVFEQEKDPCRDLTAGGIAKGGAAAPDPTAATSINSFKQDSEDTAKQLAGAADVDPDAVSEVVARGADKDPAAMAEVLAKAAEMEREAIAKVFTEVPGKNLNGLAGVVAQAAILKPLVLAEVIATGAENNREAIVRLLTRAAEINPEAIAALPDIATIRHGSPISSKATVIVTGLAPLGDGKAYEGWFVSDDGERKQSAGIVELDELGNGVATYVNENGENILGSFNTFVVTVEPVPDGDPGPSGEVALVHTIPVGGITHIRHLLFSWPPNPAYLSGFLQFLPKGIAVGLREQAETALLHAGLSLRSGRAADLAGARAHAEHVINIITGGRGTDADGNGQVENPGDQGPGVVGYAQDAADHARLAVRDAPGDATIARHAPRVVENSDGVRELAERALGEAERAASAGDVIVAQLYMANAESMLRAAVEKAEAAYVAAQDMGTFTPMPPPAAEAPKVGDSSLSRIALMALVAGLLMSLSGAYLYRQSKPHFPT